MWKIWNNNRIKEITVNYRQKRLHICFQEYMRSDLMEKMKKQYNFHLIEVCFYLSPFINANNRKKRYKTQYSTGIHQGYILDVEFGKKTKINEIYLIIDKYNYNQTEDILKDIRKNREEIEFIKKYIINYL